MVFECEILACVKLGLNRNHKITIQLYCLFSLSGPANSSFNKNCMEKMASNIRSCRHEMLPKFYIFKQTLGGKKIKRLQVSSLRLY